MKNNHRGRMRKRKQDKKMQGKKKQVANTNKKERQPKHMCKFDNLII